MPSTRKEHSQDGLVMCGGKEDKTACQTLTEDGWIKSHDLIKQRVQHSSWQTEQGLLLIGGAAGNQLNTELGKVPCH